MEEEIKEECFCSCKPEEVENEPENCPHINLEYCECCGKVYCSSCGLTWGCDKCAGVTECETEE